MSTLMTSLAFPLFKTAYYACTIVFMLFGYSAFFKSLLLNLWILDWIGMNLFIGLFGLFIPEAISNLFWICKDISMLRRGLPPRLFGESAFCDFLSLLYSYTLTLFGPKMFWVLSNLTLKIPSSFRCCSAMVIFEHFEIEFSPRSDGLCWLFKGRTC